MPTKAPPQKYVELLNKAKTRTKPQEDGSYNEADLIAQLILLIEIDIEAETKRQAKNIIDSTTKPGGTDPVGTAYLPGMEPYPYEPDRMIRDNDGHIIEQEKAPVSFKFADSDRAAKHSREAADWANRKRKETELFAAWVIKKQTEGRYTDLTFGAFMIEEGFVREEP